MVLDEALEAKIAEILRPLAKRWPEPRHGRGARGEPQAGDRARRGDDPRAGRHGARAGRAAGGRLRPDGRRAAGPAARAAADVAARRSRRRRSATRSRAPSTTRPRMLRLFGIPESEIAETLRRARDAGVDIDALEITTCLRRGEVEVVTRYEPDAGGRLPRLRGRRARAPRRHAVLRRRDDRSTSRSRRCCASAAGTIATAESCTGGLLAARITDPAGRVGLLPGRRGRLRPRGQGGARRVARGAGRARGGVGGGRARARRAGARAARHARSAWGSPASRGRAAARRRSRSGLVCFSVAGPDGSLTRSANLPGGALRRARPLHDRGDAPGPAACCWASTTECGCSSPSTCRPTSATTLARLGGRGGRRRRAAARWSRDDSLHVDAGLPGRAARSRPGRGGLAGALSPARRRRRRCRSPGRCGCRRGGRTS